MSSVAVAAAGVFPQKMFCHLGWRRLGSALTEGYFLRRTGRKRQKTNGARSERLLR